LKWIQHDKRSPNLAVPKPIQHGEKEDLNLPCCFETNSAWRGGMSLLAISKPNQYGKEGHPSLPFTCAVDHQSSPFRRWFLVIAIFWVQSHSRCRLSLQTGHGNGDAWGHDIVPFINLHKCAKWLCL
jgi:hypothetical protein